MCQISLLKIHRRCATPTDPIAVLIRRDGEDIGLCDKCWGKVSASDFEWGEGIKPENFMEWLVKGRGLEGTIETIYDPSAKGAKRHRTVTEKTEHYEPEDKIYEEEIPPEGFEDEKEELQKHEEPINDST